MNRKLELFIYFEQVNYIFPTFLICNRSKIPIFIPAIKGMYELNLLLYQVH